jgi:hypothetical protein
MINLASVLCLFTSFNYTYFLVQRRACLLQTLCILCLPMLIWRIIWIILSLTLTNRHSLRQAQLFCVRSGFVIKVYVLFTPFSSPLDSEFLHCSWKFQVFYHQCLNLRSASVGVLDAKGALCDALYDRTFKDAGTYGVSSNFCMSLLPLTFLGAFGGRFRGGGCQGCSTTSRRWKKLRFLQKGKVDALGRYPREYEANETIERVEASWSLN